MGRTFVVGDIQGCFDDFQRLLQHIDFSPQKDQLYSVGDLVNRGPDSLSVLRYFYQHTNHCHCLLGNHDVYLLLHFFGVQNLPRIEDAGLMAIFAAKDGGKLLSWLSAQPFFIILREYGMVHAGLLPNWDFTQAKNLAQELSEPFANQDHKSLQALWGFANPHAAFNDYAVLDSWPALRRMQFALNVMTRMRYLHRDGRLNLQQKGSPQNLTEEDAIPWWGLPHQRKAQQRLLFGHWSSLGFMERSDVVALDTGCVWGNELTAYCLEEKKRYSIQSTQPKRF